MSGRVSQQVSLAFLLGQTLICLFCWLELLLLWLQFLDSADTRFNSSSAELKRRLKLERWRQSDSFIQRMRAKYCQISPNSRCNRCLHCASLLWNVGQQNEKVSHLSRGIRTVKLSALLTLLFCSILSTAALTQQALIYRRSSKGKRLYRRTRLNPYCTALLFISVLCVLSNIYSLFLSRLSITFSGPTIDTLLDSPNSLSDIDEEDLDDLEEDDDDDYNDENDEDDFEKNKAYYAVSQPDRQQSSLSRGSPHSSQDLTDHHHPPSDHHQNSRRQSSRMISKQKRRRHRNHRGRGAGGSIARRRRRRQMNDCLGFYQSLKHRKRRVHRWMTLDRSIALIVIWILLEFGLALIAVVLYQRGMFEDSDWHKSVLFWIVLLCGVFSAMSHIAISLIIILMFASKLHKVNQNATEVVVESMALRFVAKRRLESFATMNEEYLSQSEVPRPPNMALSPGLDLRAQQSVHSTSLAFPSLREADMAPHNNHHRSGLPSGLAIDAKIAGSSASTSSSSVPSTAPMLTPGPNSGGMSATMTAASSASSAVAITGSLDGKARHLRSPRLAKLKSDDSGIFSQRASDARIAGQLELHSYHSSTVISDELPSERNSNHHSGGAIGGGGIFSSSETRDSGTRSTHTLTGSSHPTKTSTTTTTTRRMSPRYSESGRISSVFLRRNNSTDTVTGGGRGSMMMMGTSSSTRMMGGGSSSVGRSSYSTSSLMHGAGHLSAMPRHNRTPQTMEDIVRELSKTVSSVRRLAIQTPSPMHSDRPTAELSFTSATVDSRHSSTILGTAAAASAGAGSAAVVGDSVGVGGSSASSGSVRTLASGAPRPSSARKAGPSSGSVRAMKMRTGGQSEYKHRTRSVSNHTRHKPRESSVTWDPNLVYTRSYSVADRNPSLKDRRRRGHSQSSMTSILARVTPSSSSLMMDDDELKKMKMIQKQSSKKLKKKQQRRTSLERRGTHTTTDSSDTDSELDSAIPDQIPHLASSLKRSLSDRQPVIRPSHKQIEIEKAVFTGRVSDSQMTILHRTAKLEKVPSSSSTATTTTTETSSVIGAGAIAGAGGARVSGGKSRLLGHRHTGSVGVIEEHQDADESDMVQQWRSEVHSAGYGGSTRYFPDAGEEEDDSDVGGLHYSKTSLKVPPSEQTSADEYTASDGGYRFGPFTGGERPPSTREPPLSPGTPSLPLLHSSFHAAREASSPADRPLLKTIPSTGISPFGEPSTFGALQFKPSVSRSSSTLSGIVTPLDSSRALTQTRARVIHREEKRIKHRRKRSLSHTVTGSSRTMVSAANPSPSNTTASVTALSGLKIGEFSVSKSSTVAGVGSAIIADADPDHAASEASPLVKSTTSVSTPVPHPKEDLVRMKQGLFLVAPPPSQSTTREEGTPFSAPPPTAESETSTPLGGLTSPNSRHSLSTPRTPAASGTAGGVGSNGGAVTPHSSREDDESTSRTPTFAATFAARTRFKHVTALIKADVEIARPHALPHILTPSPIISSSRISGSGFPMLGSPDTPVPEEFPHAGEFADMRFHHSRDDDDDEDDLRTSDLDSLGSSQRRSAMMTAGSRVISDEEQSNQDDTPRETDARLDTSPTETKSSSDTPVTPDFMFNEALKVGAGLSSTHCSSGSSESHRIIVPFDARDETPTTDISRMIALTIVGAKKSTENPGMINPAVMAAESVTSSSTKSTQSSTTSSSTAALIPATDLILIHRAESRDSKHSKHSETSTKTSSMGSVSAQLSVSSERQSLSLTSSAAATEKRSSPETPGWLDLESVPKGSEPTAAAGGGGGFGMRPGISLTKLAASKVTSPSSGAKLSRNTTLSMMTATEDEEHETPVPGSTRSRRSVKRSAFADVNISLLKQDHSTTSLISLASNHEHPMSDEIWPRPLAEDTDGEQESSVSNASNLSSNSRSRSRSRHRRGAVGSSSRRIHRNHSGSRSRSRHRGLVSRYSSEKMLLVGGSSSDLMDSHGLVTAGVSDGSAKRVRSPSKKTLGFDGKGLGATASVVAVSVQVPHISVAGVLSDQTLMRKRGVSSVPDMGHTPSSDPSQSLKNAVIYAQDSTLNRMKKRKQQSMSSKKRRSIRDRKDSSESSAAVSTIASSRKTSSSSTKRKISDDLRQYHHSVGDSNGGAITSGVCGLKLPSSVSRTGRFKRLSRHDKVIRQRFHDHSGFPRSLSVDLVDLKLKSEPRYTKEEEQIVRHRSRESEMKQTHELALTSDLTQESISQQAKLHHSVKEIRISEQPRDSSSMSTLTGSDLSSAIRRASVTSTASRASGVFPPAPVTALDLIRYHQFNSGSTGAETSQTLSPQNGGTPVMMPKSVPSLDGLISDVDISQIIRCQSLHRHPSLPRYHSEHKHNGGGSPSVSPLCSPHRKSLTDYGSSPRRKVSDIPPYVLATRRITPKTEDLMTYRLPVMETHQSGGSSSGTDSALTAVDDEEARRVARGLVSGADTDDDDEYSDINGGLSSTTTAKSIAKKHKRKEKRSSLRLSYPKFLQKTSLPAMFGRETDELMMHTVSSSPDNRDFMSLAPRVSVDANILVVSDKPAEKQEIEFSFSRFSRTTDTLAHPHMVEHTSSGTTRTSFTRHTDPPPSMMSSVSGATGALTEHDLPGLEMLSPPAAIGSAVSSTPSVRSGIDTGTRTGDGRRGRPTSPSHRSDLSSRTLRRAHTINMDDLREKTSAELISLNHETPPPPFIPRTQTLPNETSISTTLGLRGPRLKKESSVGHGFGLRRALSFKVGHARRSTEPGDSLTEQWHLPRDLSLSTSKSLFSPRKRSRQKYYEKQLKEHSAWKRRHPSRNRSIELSSRGSVASARKQRYSAKKWGPPESGAMMRKSTLSRQSLELNSIADGSTAGIGSSSTMVSSSHRHKREFHSMFDMDTSLAVPSAGEGLTGMRSMKPPTITSDTSSSVVHTAAEMMKGSTMGSSDVASLSSPGIIDSGADDMALDGDERDDTTDVVGGSVDGSRLNGNHKQLNPIQIRPQMSSSYNLSTSLESLAPHHRLAPLSAISMTKSDGFNTSVDVSLSQMTVTPAIKGNVSHSNISRGGIHGASDSHHLGDLVGTDLLNNDNHHQNEPSSMLPTQNTSLNGSRTRSVSTHQVMQCAEELVEYSSVRDDSLIRALIKYTLLQSIIIMSALICVAAVSVVIYVNVPRSFVITETEIVLFLLSLNSAIDSTCIMFSFPNVGLKLLSYENCLCAQCESYWLDVYITDIKKEHAIKETISVLKAQQKEENGIDMVDDF